MKLKIFLLIISFLLYRTFISGQNVSYIPLHTESTIENLSTNTSLSSGSIAGVASINNGASGYKIDIAVPPGTNGIEPELSIQYNSMGNSSSYGYGWGLGGLSAIGRAGRNKLHDGVTSAVNFSADDRFVLNGQRLKLLNGSYGVGGSIYAFESEGFERITAFGGSPGDPSYFIMETKDGIKYEFGKDNNSRQQNNAGKAIQWHISKMIYPDGNYISYHYKEEHNWSGTLWYEHVIDEIRFTGNDIAGIMPYALIKFTYQKRTEEVLKYQGGSHETKGVATTNITISTEGQIVKNYDFFYGYRNGNTFLHEIRERGSDGTAIHKTAFKYGDLPTGNPVTATVRPIHTNDNFFTCNLNGDGLTDFLFATKSMLFPEYDSLVHGESNTAINIPLNTTSKIVSVADFNGDNMDDIIDFYLVPETSGLGSYVSYRIRVFYNTDPNGVLSYTNLYTLQPSSSNPFLREHLNNTHLAPLHTGDFNADGLADLLYINGERLFISYGQKNINQPLSAWQMVTSNISSFASIYTWGYDVEKITIMDYNGDGKSDIFVINGTTSAVFEFETNTNVREIFFDNSSSLSLANRLFDQQFLTFYGDFNGDGNTDVLVRKGSNNNDLWHINYSKAGGGFERVNFLWQTAPEITQDDFDVYIGEVVSVGDYNGDGRSDVMLLGGTPSSTFTDIYYSRGFGFDSGQAHLLSGITYLSSVVVPSYLGSDGKATTLYRVHSTQDPYDISVGYKSKENFLVKVRNGELYTTTYDYKLMNEKVDASDDFYTRGTLSNVNATSTNITVPVWLVKEFWTEDGTSFDSGIYDPIKMKTQSCKYAHAKLNRNGKGLIGFGKTEVEDKWSYLRNVTYSHANDTYGIMVQDSTVTEFVTGADFTKSVSAYNFTSAGTGRYLMTPQSIILHNYHEGRRNDQIFNSYDAFGNPTLVTSNMYGNNGASLIESKVVGTIFGAFGATFPDKPTSVTTTLSRSGQAAYSSTSIIGYNTKGQVTSRTNYDGQAKEVLYEYDYYNHGGLFWEQKSSTGLDDQKVYYYYDNKARFVNEKKNIFNNTVYVANHDPKWGKPLSITDETGKTTTNTYDAWGRIKTTTSPAGITATKNYQWQISPGIKKETITSPSKPTTVIHYDQMDRVVRSEVQGFGGQWITTNHKFDRMGNAFQSDAPRKSGEPLLTTTNTYGAAYTSQRIESTSSNISSFGTTQYQYSYEEGIEMIRTIAPDGKETISAIDASGKTIQTTDSQGNVLDYTYFSHGGLKEVKKENTVLVSIEYDEYHRKKKQTDISAGITMYDYDAYGRLYTETNAKGQVTTMIYDELDRLEFLIRPEGIITYEYYAHGVPGKAYKLKKVIGYEGDIHELDYDIYSRVISEKTTIDGQIYETTTSYDGLDRIQSRTLPSGLTLQYDYDPYSYLKRIYSGSTTYMNIDEVNGRGQTTKYTLGNGKQSIHTYFHGIPTKYATSDGYFEYNMQWDYKNGNLMKRWDQYGNKDTMEYDILDRLVRWTSQGSNMTITRDTMTYADNGNILSKSDVGVYTYDPVKIYATTEITNPKGLIKDAEQHISYNSFFQPDTITEGPYRLVYTYGYHGNRIKSVLYKNNVIQETKYYIGDYEKVVTSQGTAQVQYISMEGQMKVIISSQGSNHTPYYVYTDHLGSILDVTNASGISQGSQSYDPWGRRRNMGLWTSYIDENLPNTRPIWYYRGYTGHEHIREFRLINMNGRMYDPELARMLSPDNLIQDGGFSQNYNRYSYAYNNPLKYSDPDGNEILSILGYAITSVFINGVNNLMNHKPFFEGAVQSAFVGVAQGVFSIGIGQIASTIGNEFLRAGFQVLAHGHAGGAFSSIQGGSYADGFVAGAISSASSSIATALKLGPQAVIAVGSISGGLSAIAIGGNFWQGLRQGFVIAALNHVMHEDVVDGNGGGDPRIEKAKVIFAEQYLNGEISQFEYLMALDVIDQDWSGVAADIFNKHMESIITLGAGAVGKLVQWGLAARGANTGVNVVYRSVNNGVTEYVGITNNFARRAAEHLSSKGISISPLMKNLSRSDAKAVEQALIEIHGLSKFGGTLINRINSISIKNPSYSQQLMRGYDLLKSIGYK